MLGIETIDGRCTRLIGFFSSTVSTICTVTASLPRLDPTFTTVLDVLTTASCDKFSSTIGTSTTVDESSGGRDCDVVGGRTLIEALGVNFFLNSPPSPPGFDLSKPFELRPFMMYCLVHNKTTRRVLGRILFFLEDDGSI